MTCKCSCLEVIKVFEQCRVCSGGGDSRLSAERSNLQLVCLLHFLARYHDSLISLPATHKYKNPFQLFKGSEINPRNCTEPVAYPGILFWGGGFKNSVEDRENRDVGAVAPLVRGFWRQL